MGVRTNDEDELIGSGDVVELLGVAVGDCGGHSRSTARYR